MIHLVRFSMIVVAILLAPLYGLWLIGGRIADKRGQAKVKDVEDRRG